MLGECCHGRKVTPSPPRAQCQVQRRDCLFAEGYPSQLDVACLSLAGGWF